MRMIERVRKFQPGMLCADRTIGGPYENYVTPEQCVPEEPLMIPWESCITLGTSFSFVYEDTYKSPRDVICLLVDIVVKGGNLAINVGPQPNGCLPKALWIVCLAWASGWTSMERQFMAQEYAHRTRRTELALLQRMVLFTAIETFASETQEVPSKVWIPYEGKVTKISDMADGRVLSFEVKDGGYLVDAGEWAEEKAPIGCVFCLENEEK